MSLDKGYPGNNANCTHKQTVPHDSFQLLNPERPQPIPFCTFTVLQTRKMTLDTSSL
eukprot:c25570_g1_i1 orf=3-173(-)